MTDSQCIRCGNCCRGVFLVELDCFDIIREPRLKQHARRRGSVEDAECRTREERNEDGTLENFVTHDGSCHILELGVPCAFLSDDGCSIYPSRPLDCVAFTAGGARCLDVRPGGPGLLH